MEQIRPRITPQEYQFLLAHREKTGTQQRNHLHNKLNIPDPDKPKVLLLDIETSQMEGKFWDLKINGYIPHHRITKPSFVICYSAEWLFQDGMMNDRVTSQEAIMRDDKRVLQSAWDLLDMADIVIGHNVKKFDVKKLNSRFFIHKMLPPRPYKMIDTLVESRKAFAHASHKLDFISQLISNKKKIKTDIELWDDCEAGDFDRLVEMQTYCDEDVYLLQEAYIEIRPWIKSHPNLALFTHTSDSNAPFNCPYCNEAIDPEKIVWDTHHTTTISRFKSFRHSCGGFVHTRNRDQIAVIKSVP